MLEAKFSRHLIIRLQKTAFKDNSHAGAFIAEVCPNTIERDSNAQSNKNMSFVHLSSCQWTVWWHLFRYAHGLIMRKGVIEGLKSCLFQKTRVLLISLPRFLSILLSIQEIVAFAYLCRQKQGRILFFYLLGDLNVRTW